MKDQIVQLEETAGRKLFVALFDEFQSKIALHRTQMQTAAIQYADSNKEEDRAVYAKYKAVVDAWEQARTVISQSGVCFTNLVIFQGKS